jgi:hypothetical protein
MVSCWICGMKAEQIIEFSALMGLPRMDTVDLSISRVVTLAALGYGKMRYEKASKLAVFDTS